MKIFTAIKKFLSAIKKIVKNVVAVTVKRNEEMSENWNELVAADNNDIVIVDEAVAEELEEADKAAKTVSFVAGIAAVYPLALTLYIFEKILMETGHKVAASLTPLAVFYVGGLIGIAGDVLHDGLMRVYRLAVLSKDKSYYTVNTPNIIEVS